MIARIRGRLDSVRGESVFVDVHGITYGVYVSPSTAEKLVSTGKVGAEILLFTMHSIEGGIGMGTLLPRLVGFLSESELEFFLLFISVPGLGVRKALRAFVIPIPEIALAIEREDILTLKKLPEIGAKTAQKIIMELKGKAVSFAGPASMDSSLEPLRGQLKEEYQAETVEILIQLQYPEAEARDVVLRTSKSRPDIATSQELLQEIFRRRGHGSGAS